MSTPQLGRAIVLCDVVSHALKAGQILEASPELIKALTADGSVDPAKAAVAYASEQGAAVVRSVEDARRVIDEERARHLGAARQLEGVEGEGLIGDEA